MDQGSGMLRKLQLPFFLLMFSIAPMWAQGRFELQPFVGLKTGGSFPVQCTNICPSSLNFSKISFDTSLLYGATAGVNLKDNLGVEFLWNRQPTVGLGRLSNGNSARRIDVNIDQYQGNVVYTFFENERKFRPFILMGVG